MARETVRRLLLLAIVGTVAAGWVVALQSTAVTVVPTAAAAQARPSVARLAACPFPRQLRTAFERAASDAALPAGMLFAVAKVESNLHEDAESAAGARGLMQVMPRTAQSLDLDVDEPSSNVLAGARYLRQLIDRFGNVDLALAAYNAGPTAVTAAGGAPSRDVLTYVANVNAVWHSVAGCR